MAYDNEVKDYEHKDADCMYDMKSMYAKEVKGQINKFNKEMSWSRNSFDVPEDMKAAHRNEQAGP